MITQQEKVRLLDKFFGNNPWIECSVHGEVAEERAGSVAGELTCPWCGKPLVRRDVVDYFNDSNAIRKMVSRLSASQLESYADRLQELSGWSCVGVVGGYRGHLQALARLTATHPSICAEALGLSLKLWNQ